MPKICPILAHAVLTCPSDISATTANALRECEEESCAWWTGEMCAVVAMLPAKLLDIDLQPGQIMRVDPTPPAAEVITEAITEAIKRNDHALRDIVREARPD